MVGIYLRVNKTLMLDYKIIWSEVQHIILYLHAPDMRGNRKGPTLLFQVAVFALLTVCSASASTFTAHEIDVNAYYLWIAGERYTFFCPEGHIYNESTQTCFCIACANELVELCPDTPSCYPGENGMVKVYPPDCQKYIYCDALGNTNLRKCPISQHFSPTVLQCQDQSIAGCSVCSVTTPPPTTTQLPTTTPTTAQVTLTTMMPCASTPECGENDMGMLLPYPSDCTLYIYCDENLEEILSVCPPGTHFSAEVMDCVSPEEANCAPCQQTTSTLFVSTITTTSTSTLSTTTTEVVGTTLPTCPATPNCEEGNEGSLLPFPPDCTKYIYCDFNGQEVLSICPVGMHFSAEISDCVSPEIANCPLCVVQDSTTSTSTTQEDTTTTQQATDPPTTTTDITTTDIVTSSTIGVCPENPTCLTSEIGFNKPYPPDCTKYIYCNASGPGRLRTCPAPNHFSPQLLYCTTPELAACPLCEVSTTSTSTTTTSTTPRTTTIGQCDPTPTCGILEIGATKPYPPECTVYIYCNGLGNAVKSVCPKGYHFSPTEFQCMPADLANCPLCWEISTTVLSTSTPEITTTQTTSTVPTIPVCPPTDNCGPEDDGMSKPYPSDCSMYIYCEAEVGELSACPSGQHFSPTLFRCMSPEFANCPYCENLTTTVASTDSSVTDTPQITTPWNTTLVSSTIVSETTTVTVCVEPTPCTPEEVYYYKPYPPDCTKYIYCDDVEGALLSVCPEGQHFSPTELICMLPELASCPYCEVVSTTEITTRTSTTTVTSTELTTLPICDPIPYCYATDINYLKPYPPDCTKYIYCNMEGEGRVRTCPNGQQFNLVRSMCMPPALANCPLCQISTTTVTTPSTTLKSTTTTEQTSTMEQTTTTETTITELSTLPECPPTPTCTPEEAGVQKPYPSDCNQYIYCNDDGDAELSTCPEGLHYNADLMICLPPELANCPLCQVTTTTTSITTELTTINSPSATASQTTVTITSTLPVCDPVPMCSATENGYKKPYPPDCTKYVYCDKEGAGILRRCISGWHFSPVLLTCLDPALANCPACQLTTLPATTSSTTAQITSTTQSTTQEISSTTPPTPTTTTEVTTPTIPECPPVPSCSIENFGDMLPYPPDCKKYIYCSETGEAELSVCPGDLYFNAEYMACTTFEEADCFNCIVTTSSTTEETTTSTTTERITESTTQTSSSTSPPTTIAVCPITPTCGSGELGAQKPYPPDCSYYIYCNTSTGESYSLRKCRPPTLFSPTMSKCMDPAVANCPYCEVSTTTTTTSTVEPTTIVTTLPPCEPTPTCSLSDFGKKKPYPSNCSVYIYCDELGNSQLSYCPAGQHFSPLAFFCTTPEIANCPSCELVTTITPPTTEEPPNCPHIPTCSKTETATLKPYPPDCSKYVQCGTGGDTKIVDCPGGQHFSADLSTCLAVDEANCQYCTVPVCPKQPSCLGQPTGTFLPVPHDCGLYLYCDGSGHEDITACIPGLHFSAEIEMCVDPAVANCEFCVLPSRHAKRSLWDYFSWWN